MIIRQSVYARLCNVKPPSISELIKRGLIIKTAEGKIDLDNPVNRAYLERHGGQVPTAQTAPLPTDAPQPSATPLGKSPRRAPAPAEAAPPPPPPKPEKHKKPKTDAASLALAAIRAGQAAADEDDAGDSAALGGGDFSEDELKDVLRRALYESRKIKNEAEIKAVQLDKLHGTLGEREIFDSFILELWQSLQRNYIDVAPTQATLICKRLSMVGHEIEVVEVLEGDIKKRQDSVAHEVNAVLLSRLTNKHGLQAEASDGAALGGEDAE